MPIVDELLNELFEGRQTVSLILPSGFFSVLVFPFVSELLSFLTHDNYHAYDCIE